MSKRVLVIQAGFGKADISHSWKTVRKTADELSVRVFATFTNDEKLAVIAVFDLGLLWTSVCTKLRQKISSIYKIPVSNISVFATQNHSIDSKPGPYSEINGLLQPLTKAVGEAINNIQPVEMAIVSAKSKVPLNYCRRKRFGKLGAFTFWYGVRDLGKGKADAAHLMKMAIRNLADGVPLQYRGMKITSKKDFIVKDCPVDVPQPLLLDKASDQLIQGLFFRNAEGKPVGSIIRFAAHPVTANPSGCDYNSGDYPLYVCRKVEKSFGGRALFLPGPCGDILPLVESKSLALAEKVGDNIAKVALNALKKGKWECSGVAAVAVQQVKFNIRSDIPKNMKEAKRELALLKSRIEKAAADKRPLAEIKKMTERYEIVNYMVTGLLQIWTGHNLFKLSGKEIEGQIFALRLGRAVIAGLPGEPFGAYSVRLRKETIGDQLLTAEQCNGYIGYLPTAEEFKFGGYGPAASLCDHRCEKQLVQFTKHAINRVSSKLA
ncbi:MAG: hypothetical protein JNL74_14050 [Fibrobacteres bacterium]|nr:hypothetical protein [Fibrobacterota bacterium]